MGGTASVLAARPALAALETKGIDVGEALRSAGFSREALERVENRLPYASVCRVWQACADASGDPWFGLHVAEGLPMGAYDVVDYLFSTSVNVGEGLRRLTEYIRIIYDRSQLTLVTGPGLARLIWRRARAAPQYDEFRLAHVLIRSQQATGVAWRPERVRFRHDRPEDLAEAKRILAPSVQYQQSAMEIEFSREVLELPHRAADSGLLPILVRHADSLLSALPDHDDVVACVSSCIAREMRRGLPSLLTTAAALHRSPRTLQRQLTRRGANHSALVDDVRRGLAMKYIGDAALSLSEIGFVLHFSDASAFNRAFRRWTGETPALARSRLLGPAPRQLEPAPARTSDH